MGGSPIWDEGRSYEGVNKRGDSVKIPRHIMVGETGKFDKSGILRGAPPSGADMDDDGANT